MWGAGCRKCKRCDDATGTGSARGSEARALRATADGVEQKGSVLANVTHHLRRSGAPAISADKQTRTAEHIGKSGFRSWVTELRRQGPPAGVECECQIPGSEMEGCRRHMQDAHLGFARDGISQIRQHALDGNAKPFGTLAHFSCNHLGRN